MVLLELPREAWCSSQLVMDFREPLVLPQVSQVSLQVARGSVGLLSSHWRGIGPHLGMSWKCRGDSQVAVGSFGFLSSSDGNLREPLMLPQGSQDSSHVARDT